MALEKHTNSAVSEKSPPAPGMTQRQRWWKFGPNVLVAIALATVIAFLGVWLSGTLIRGRARSDWTKTGRFSLSPRTKALVADLPCDVRITNLYIHSPDNPQSEEMFRRVQDLVSQYGAASSKVTVEEVNPAVDAGGVEGLVKRLRERYAGELEKPKALIEDYGKIQKDLGAFLPAEAKRLTQAAAAWKDAPPDATNALRMVAQRWTQFAAVGQFVEADVTSQTEQALPAYSTAVARIKEYFKQVGDNFAAVPELYGQLQDAAKKAPAPEEVNALLAGAKTTYEPFTKQFAEFDKKSADLKELELDDIRRDISQGDCILLESPTQIKVVGLEDVWVRNPQADEQHPDVPERLFAGESAVSSTLLSMCKPDKPAVLFVTFGAPATMGGNPMMGGGGGAFAQMAARLRKAIFIVEDWDLARSP